MWSAQKKDGRFAPEMWRISGGNEKGDVVIRIKQDKFLWMMNNILWELWWYIVLICCRPPWEVVNWKCLLVLNLRIVKVDLLERSWIERFLGEDGRTAKLRRPPWEVVNWKLSSSATAQSSGQCRPPWEVVNWKHQSVGSVSNSASRPPWEVVNWKIGCLWGTDMRGMVDLLERSWIERRVNLNRVQSFLSSTSLRGRELKDLSQRITAGTHRRPPWEVVNWKTLGNRYLQYSVSSTSLRGRELKDILIFWILLLNVVDLLERSWIERRYLQP